MSTMSRYVARCDTRNVTRYPSMCTMSWYVARCDTRNVTRYP